jgi:hypothetical protein
MLNLSWLKEVIPGCWGLLPSLQASCAYDFQTMVRCVIKSYLYKWRLCGDNRSTPPGQRFGFRGSFPLIYVSS